MKKISLWMAAFAALAALSADAQEKFIPKHLAVLRAGDGVMELHLKQSPVFIDQFAPGMFNDAPSFTVSIPTNGPNTLFINGHAATEGILTRSADGRFLAFAGYGGVSLLQSNGTPSLLEIERGFCTVDAAGSIHTMVYGKQGDKKMNPRGVVTDGTGNFWGCGNSLGTVYYNPADAREPVEFEAIPNSRDIKIINKTLYTTLNQADGTASDLPAGIFSFADTGGVPAPLPKSAGTKLVPVVQAESPYNKIAGFDINPEETVAYTADAVAGIQKYVKTGGVWKFAYNFSIPQNIPASKNRGTGCFALVVDFSGPAPVIYATTTEGYGGSVNSNRVVQVVDTNAMATVTTLAQAGSVNIAYRGVGFTPESQSAGQ
jgi:hypothetical protein